MKKGGKIFFIQKNRLALLCAFFLIPFINSCSAQQSGLVASELIELGEAQQIFESRIFDEEMQVTMHFRLEGASIHYTLDGSEPDEQSLKYTAPITLRQSTELRSRVYHPDYLPGHTSVQYFFRSQRLPADTKVIWKTPPKAPYDQAAPDALFDFEMGTMDFRKDASWLGFQEQQVQVKLQFPKAIKIQSVRISFLEDQPSWIFLPHQITLSTNGRESAEPTIIDASTQHASGLKVYEISDEEMLTDYIDISLQNVGGLPDWHPGHGSNPWFFIDEIIIE